MQVKQTIKKYWKKVAIPIGVLGLGIAGMSVISATASEEEEKEAVDTRPTVSIEQLVPVDHDVIINSFGEVTALENTQLAAQVSGEVVTWNPNFVAGGLVKRGDILFSIEKDSYEAALLKAEADLSLAKAQLIEEQARADVAKREARNMPKTKVTDLYLRKPQVLSAQAAVKSAEARLKIANRDLANCDVTAPYDALVISRNLGVGQFVSQGASVAQLSNIEVAEITIPIAGFDSAFLPGALEGHPVSIVSKGVKEVRRRGEIARDLGVVDRFTRMSQLVIRIEDPYSLQAQEAPLKFGSYVEVTFTGRTLNNIFKLRQELVNNQTVWVIEEGKMQPKTVNILREEGEFFLIDDGLTADEQMVTTLPEYPQKGQEVKIAEQADELVARQED